MEAILFLVHPNDLEKLIVQAETPQDVLESSLLHQSLYLGDAWESLHEILQTPDLVLPALSYVIQAEHPLSERNVGKAVTYNTVVRTDEIYHALEKIHVDEVKKHYQFSATVITQQLQTQELKLAELKLIYLQLQDLYRDAAQQNMAVLSVIQDGIQPAKLI